MKLPEQLRSLVFSRLSYQFITLLSTIIFVSGVYANPVLDNVSAGTTVQQSGNTTTINQTTQHSVINWQSYNVAGHEQVIYQQPNSSSISLNRIDPTQGASQIYGRITANGQVWLINPAGIYFGPSAHVNVGGLIASTANITDHDFLNGFYHFASVPNFNGAIVSKGQLVAADHGLIALIGGAVQNDGSVEANLGKVVMASGSAFTMNFGGQGDLINFVVDGQSTSRAVDQNGNELSTGVKNTGSIIANGGSIYVSARAVSGVLDNMINMQGVAVAKSVRQVNGDLILGNIVVAGDKSHGAVMVAGKLDASGKGAGEKGGSINITGYNLLLDSSSLLDVSGDIGGGNINIGGNFHGTGPLPNANAVVIAPDAKIYADAITNGNGGNIAIWSDNYTAFYGDIFARGGAVNGNGGFVETSSADNLQAYGNVDASAINGSAGDWLLDPADITITTSTTNGTFNGGSPNVFTPNSGAATANVLNTTIQTSLNGGTSVTINTTNTGAAGAGVGNITVNSTIAKTAGAAATLTLNAGTAGSIAVNAAITSTTGALNVVLNAGTGNITLGANITTLNGTFSAVTTGSTSSITQSAGTINTGTGARTFTVPTTSTGGIGTSTTSIASTSTGTLTLTTGFGGAYINNTGSFTLAAPTLAVNSPLSIISSGVLTLPATLISTGTGNIDLRSNGGALTINAGGLATTTGSINLVASTTITINGPISTGAMVGNVNQGTLTINAGSNSAVTTAAAGAINVNNFNLERGMWSQLTASLPVFNIYNNFQINSGSITPSAANTTQFLRATGGTGAVATPYTLTDIYGVQGMGSSVTTLGNSFTLVNNIDASNTQNWVNAGGFGFNPIGSASTRYSGTFSGNNFNGNNIFGISNLFIYNTASRDTGFFSTLGGGTVRNIAFVNANVNSNSAAASSIGILVGSSNSGTATAITGVSVTGNVNAYGNNTFAGGLVGYNFTNSAISTSYSGANVTMYGTSNTLNLSGAGGLVGQLNGGSIANSYATGNVTLVDGATNSFAGGLIGYTNGAFNTSTSYASGLITGSTGNGNAFGGLVGTNSSGTYTNTFWDATTTNQAAASGGGAISGISDIAASNPLVSSNYTGWTINTTIGTSNTAPTGTWYQFNNSTRPMLVSEMIVTAGGTVSNLNVITPHQVQMMASTVNGSYSLGGNINMNNIVNQSDVWRTTTASGGGFLPLGTSGSAYTGNINGNFYFIENLYIYLPASSNVGLVGLSLTSGTPILSINNLGLVNANVTGANYVGAMLGRGSLSGGNIYSSNGTVTGTGSTGNVGGLVGSLENGSGGTIQGAYSSGAVIFTGSGSNIGGFIGQQLAANIFDSYSTASVNGGTGNNVGGFIGRLNTPYGNSRNYSTGAVTGSGSNIGGYAGIYVNAGTWTNNFWDIVTTGRTNGTGTGSGSGVTGGCFAGSGTCTSATITNAANAGVVTPVNLAAASTYSSWSTSITSTSATSSTSPAFMWFIFNNATRPMLMMEYSTNIYNAHQLQLAGTTLGASYRLMNDINLSSSMSNAAEIWGTNSGVTGAGFLPIGNSSSGTTYYFTGSLNGQNYTINNLYMNVASNIQSNIGLFGDIGSSAAISNVNLTNANITVSAAQVTGSNTNIGALVGKSNSTSTLLLNNDVQGNLAVILSSDGARIGGLVGWNSGHLYNNNSLANVTATLSGTAFGNIGGAIGYNGNGFTNSIMSLGTVTANLSTNNAVYTGGLIGANFARVTNTYSVAPVTVTGSSSIYAIGGLVGNNGAAITTSYSSGAVTATAGTNIIGGFVGDNTGGTIASSFWDTDTSGRSTGATNGTISLTGGCFTGTCTNGGSANLSLASTYSGAGWSITSTASTTSAAPTTTWFLFSTVGNTINTRPMLMSELSKDVSTPHQLQMMGTTLGKYYQLTGNINLNTITNASDVWGTSTLTGTGFVSIGNITTGNFSGTLIGTSSTPFVISNLYMNYAALTLDTGDLGLFGTLNGSVIQNIGLTNATFNTPNNNNNARSLGILAGNSSGKNTITNVYVRNSTLTVPSSIALSNNFGGLIGSLSSTSLLTNAYAANVVMTVAGSSSTTGIGGLVGSNSGTISSSYATGTIGITSPITVPQIFVGGLVGFNQSGASIYNSYAAVSSIISTNNASSAVGGFVGRNAGSITTSYSLGNVSSTAGNAGGFVGNNSSSITNSYWNTDTSLVSSNGTNSGTITNLNGLSTANMMTQAQLSNLNFTNTWSMIANQSFPYLKWQFSSTPQAVSGFISSAPETATIALTSNDTVLNPSVTLYSSKNGYYYNLLTNNSISNGSILAVSAVLPSATNGMSMMLASGTNASVSGATAGSGLDITASTVTLNLINGNITPTQMNTVIGSGAHLVSGTPYYSISGNNISLASTLSFATTGANTYQLLGNITSNPSGSNGNIIFDTPVNLAATSVISTNSGGGNFGLITFNNTLNGAQSLTVNSNANITFGGTVGAANPLVGLTITNSQNTYFNANTFLSNLTVTNTSNFIYFLGNLTIAQFAGASTASLNTTANPYGFTFSGNPSTTTTVTTSNPASATTLLNTGANTFGSTSSSTVTFTNGLVNTASSFTLDLLGSIITSGTAVVLGAVNLLSNFTIDTTNGGAAASGATITVGAMNAQSNSISLNAGNNNISLGAVTNATSLTSAGTGTVNLLGGGVATTGTQSYGGNVAVTGTATFTGTNLTFNGGITGSNGALTLNTSGTALVSGVIGNTITNLNINPLSSSYTGTVTLNSANLFTGNTAITRGILNITNSEALSAGAVSVSGTLRLGSTGLNVNNEITLNNGATLNDNGSGGTNTLGASTLQLPTTAGQSVTISTTNAGQTLQINSNLNNNNANIINLTFTGTGTTSIGPVNSFLGNINITGGNTLQITDGSALGNLLSNTLNFNNGTLSLINSGLVSLGATAITLTGNGTFNVDTGGLGESNGLSGSGTLTKTGSGTLYLFGNNNAYTGNMNVNGGTLGFVGTTVTLGANIISGELGTTIYFNDTASNFGASSTLIADTILATGVVPTSYYAGSVSSTQFAPLKINTTSNNVFTIGNITNDYGNGVVVSGAGTTIFNGSNTFSGGVAVSNGTLSLQNVDALGSATSTTINAGATLNINVNGTLNNTNTINIAGTGVSNLGALTFTGTGSIMNNELAMSANTTIGGAGSGTVDGVISGNFNLTKIGNGTTTLGNTANTYDGITTINAGTLGIAADTSLGTAPVSTTAGKIVLGGGILQFNNSMALDANRGISLTANSGLSVNGTSATASYAGIITGAFGLIVNNAANNTLTLSGANTFGDATHGVTVSSGILNIANNSALGVSAAPTVVNNATLQLTGTSLSIAHNISLSNATILENNANGNNVLTGTLALTGSNTFNIANIVTDTLTINGQITGSGITLNKSGFGILALNNNTNSFTGNVAISRGRVDVMQNNALGSTNTNVTVSNSNGALRLASAGALSLPTGVTITLNNGTLQNDNVGFTTNIAGAISISGSNANISSTSATGFTLSGALNGSGTLNLNNFGAQTITMSSNASGTFNGTINIIDGMLAVGNNNALSSATVNVNAGKTLQLNNNVSLTNTISLNNGSNLNSLSGTTTLGALSSTGTTNVNVIAGTLTVGALSGTSVTINKLGTGTLGLNSAGSISGTTNINAGTLTLGHASALGTTTLNINNATLNIGSSLGSNVTNAMNLSSATVSTVGTNTFATGAISLTGTNIFSTTGTLSVGNALSGSGTLNANGSGTVILPNANGSYNGAFVLSAGTVQIGNNAALGTGAVTLAGGTLSATGTISNLTNVMTVSGNTTIGGSNNITFNAASPNTINAGVTLTIANSATTTFSNVLQGNGSLLQTGGTLVLSAANTYGVANTTSTTLSGGTLQVGNNAALGIGNIALNGGTLQANTNGINLANGYQVTANSIIGGNNNLTLSGNGNLNNATTLSINNTGTTTLSGTLSGAGSLTVNAGANTTVSGSSNSYSGTTNINDSGILTVASNNGLGTSAIIITNPSYVLPAFGNQTAPTSGLFLNSVNLGNNSITLNNGALSVTSGNTAIVSGPVIVTNTANNAIYANSTGSLIFNNNINAASAGVGTLGVFGTGAVTINGEVGNVNNLASYSVWVSTYRLGGTEAVTTGDQYYAGNIVLTNDAIFRSLNGNIYFDSNINNDPTQVMPQPVVISAPNGDVYLGYNNAINIGMTNMIGAFSATAKNIYIYGSINQANPLANVGNVVYLNVPRSQLGINNTTPNTPITPMMPSFSQNIYSALQIPTVGANTAIIINNPLDLSNSIKDYLQSVIAPAKQSFIENLLIDFSPMIEKTRPLSIQKLMPDKNAANDQEFDEKQRTALR